MYHELIEQLIFCQSDPAWPSIKIIGILKVELINIVMIVIENKTIKVKRKINIFKTELIYYYQNMADDKEQLKGMESSRW